MRKAKAFTLIELLVVIAIIALLLAILMPSLNMAKEHAKRLLCGKDLSSIGVALAMYANQEDDELPPGTPDNPVHAYYVGTYQYWGNSGFVAALNAGPASARLDSMMDGSPPGTPEGWGPNNLGRLMAADLIDPSFPELLYCTSDKSGKSYETYGGDEEWPLRAPDSDPAGDDTARIRMSYSYRPQHRYKKMSSLPEFPATAKKYSQMDPARSVVLDLIRSGAMSHSSGNYIGVNILYGDGSCEFKRDDNGIMKETFRQAKAEGVTVGSAGGRGALYFHRLIKALE